VKQFLGEIDQKTTYIQQSKDGIRLYEHAAGETVEIGLEKTTIHEFEIELSCLKLTLG
jgi:tRNA U55 pseudouridine synthase TruB